MASEKSQSSLRESVRYWAKIVWSSKFTYLFGIVAVAGTNVVEVAIPKIIGKNIDALAQTHTFERWLVFTLLGTFVLQFFCRIVWRRTLAMQTFHAARRLKASVWDQTRFFPLALFHQRYTRGELINLATGDVNYAQNSFGFHFVATSDFLFLLILSVGAMLSISVKLTLVSLVLFPLIPGFIYYLCQKEGLLYEASQVSLSKLNDTVDAIVGAARLMKLRPHSPLWNKKLHEDARHYQQQRALLLMTEAQFFPATALPPATSVAIFLFFGLKEFAAGHISVGGLIAFHAYLFMLSGPLSELGWLVSDWQKSFSSLRRLIALFNEPRDAVFSARAPPTDLAKPLLIKRLAFSYQPSEPALLRIDELSLAPRERLGIKGDVGSGKSTLARMIAGLEPGYSGKILLYGTEVKTFANDSLRQRVALVDQNPFLFGATIRENLALDRTMNDSDLWDWLETVDLAQDFKTFSEGLGSHLGEWGVNLSGGQRQRLTLARALCRKPELLILDDALSAVDVVTEAKIISRLEKKLSDLSVIIISHRVSSLALCHRQFTLGEPA